MIYYNSNTINDWNFGDDNIIKVYRNNAIVFYKFDSETQEFKVCYAVVADITQYTDREFEDVFNLADEKWYKLNNLNQYEQYGVYGSGRNVTTYKGKLTIDDGYEYEWNGSSWVNVGEVSGSSRLPQGYTEVEYVQHSNDVHSINDVFWTVPNDGVSGNVYTVDLSLDSSQSQISRYIQLFGSTYGYCYRQDSGYRYNANVGYMTKINYSNSYAPPYDTKLRYRLEPLELTVTNTVASTSVTINLSSSRSFTTGSTDFGVFNANMYDSGAYFLKGKIYNILIEDSNGVVKHNYVPCKRDGDNVIGLYDIIGNGFYNPSVLIVTAGEEVSHKIYPKYYSEKSEPLNNLTFNTIEEADDYAYNNCVYAGLNVVIDGDKYIFSGDSQSGYEWVYKPSRLPQGYTEVEYIENTSTAYINTEVLLYDSTTNSYNIQCKCYFQPYGNDFEYLFGTEGTSSPYVGVTFRYYQRNIQYASSPNNNVSWTHTDNGDGTSGVTASCASTTATNGNNPLTLFCGLWSTGPWRNGMGKIYSFKVTKNNTLVRDLVPAKRDSDEKYGMYDIVNDVFYVSPNNVNFSGGGPV